MIKKFLITILSITAASAALLTGCAQKPASTADNAKSETAIGGTLNIYTWDGMFSPELLQDFEQQFGVKVNFTHFDSDEEMLAKLAETDASKFDIVIADDYILEQTINEGLADKLDKSLLPNIANVNPVFQGQYYDPSDEYTIPYGSGIPLIVYDREAVGFEIKSYADLWDARLQDSLALVGNYRLINGIALKSMGESLNTTDLSKIEAAGAKLLTLAPNVRVISDSNTHESLLSRDVNAAFLYTSQVNAAIAADPDLSICYPSEGLGFGIMPAFIPKNAPNKAAAHAFLNYIMQPEIGAKCFEHIQYFCTFKASEQHISDTLKPILILPEGIGESEIMKNVTVEAEDMHTKVWTEFKAACD